MGKEFYKLWKNGSQGDILVVNCGSSSIKITLFDQKERLVDADLNGIGSNQSKLTLSSFQGSETKEVVGPINISKGILFLFNELKEQFKFEINSLKGIGHRFVHGGPHFTETTKINLSVLQDLEKISDLAPLHNHACIAGIKVCTEQAKEIDQYAIFDTAFYVHMPAVASHYALPIQLATKHHIKRYGFHGISHAFLWQCLNEHLKHQKVITLHLGSGCSATAIKDGIPLDTSMGFSPLEGLVMGTRTGDIDPAVMAYLCKKEQKSPDEVIRLFDFESGLLGLSDKTSKMEELMKVYSTDIHAKLAVDMFCYRIVKYIGSYLSVLGGFDALVFSGGIGENAFEIREKIIDAMAWYGLKIDSALNRQVGGLPPGSLMKVSDANSKVPIYVITTDENRYIDAEVRSFLRS